jgi:hypothetical protein
MAAGEEKKAEEEEASAAPEYIVDILPCKMARKQSQIKSISQLKIKQQLQNQTNKYKSNSQQQK